ncbi:uncharacterized protein LOC143463557 [Clavelina lepadiformis]|uniref:uncharacterized protein LOC143463557 n=1 Tax=Clavelina lepadiformis TaxID=159417 RepID=UPI0040413554
MSVKSEILDLLIPVFACTLADEELNDLAEKLYKNKYISSENLESVKSCHGAEKVYLFVKALKQTRKDGLRFVLPIQIEKSQLSELIERLFEDASNPQLLWLLKSWDVLLTKEAKIRKIVEPFITKKVHGEMWLVEVAYYIAAVEVDSETLIKAMQDEIRKTDNVTVKTSPNSQKMQNTQPCQCAKEIEQKLTPLIPMLTDTLCYSEVYQVAECLKNDQQISKGI